MSAGAATVGRMDLTPVQERTLRRLLGAGDPRPVFPRDLAVRVRRDLERRLAPAAAGLAEGARLWVTKARLADLHARCEGLFLAGARGEGGLELGREAALGILAHKAVEIAVHAPRLAEAEAVGGALRRLARDDRRFAAFHRSLDGAEVALLVGEAVRRLALFRATFPPLRPSWSPAVEVPLRASMCGGRVVLSARPDLILGGADRADPGRARRLIVDLKTGPERPEHRDDLRFYALVATLRFGVPPFRVATVTLEDGGWRAEDVAPGVLAAAARRVEAGAAAAARLLEGAEPALRPGPWCGWCPRAATCPRARRAG